MIKMYSFRRVTTMSLNTSKADVPISNLSSDLVSAPWMLMKYFFSNELQTTKIDDALL